MESGFLMPDIAPVIPEIVLAAAALALLLLDLIVKRKEGIALLGIVSAVATAYFLTGASGSTFGGMFVADGYARFFKLIFLISLSLSILISIRYISVERVNLGEYYCLMLLATVGMMIMASAGDLIVLYLGLELMSLSLYVLAGFMRMNVKSNESAIKYFLLGSFASAFLLFGISMIYGLTGTTELVAVASYIDEAGLGGSPMLTVSIVFIVVAFGFKIAAVPFHMWVPDVYEGAPTSVTAFMSVGPKAAAFAALGRVFLVAFSPVSVDWAALLVPMAVLTIAVGNVMAIAQTNIKRMLAYSSIAHAGYALLGVIAGGAEGVAGMMNYLFIYAFMNIGAFSVIILLRSGEMDGDNISDYRGLSKRHPVYAAMMLLFMFSLTGIPPTAGFIGKFFVFMAAVNAGYTWLVVVAVIFSAVSAYFYLRIVMYMYMQEPEGELSVEPAPALNIALVVSAAAVLAIGVMPSALIALARDAARSF